MFLSNSNQGHFRSVATLLISATIIVIGMVCHQALATFSPTASLPNLPHVDSDIVIASITPAPSANLNSTDSATPTPPASITPSTNSLSQLTESLTTSLTAVRQFLGLTVKTPPATSIFPTASIDTDTTSAAPAPSESTTKPTTPSKGLLTTIKNITGYSKWEQFKTNFREAQQKYAGTGKCMIDIPSFGCLVQW